ncbi:MAG: hypothetical protein MJZ60_08840 [Bacteroidaceae bacterium]|nr:hypothetical protein [Bacteroidaceae bacterium]
MEIIKKFAHSKDEAVDLSAKGITGKTQKWFNEQFIIAGAYTAPSLGNITFSGGTTVEVGASLTTSQTLKVTLTKADSGGYNASGTKTMGFTPKGGTKSSQAVTPVIDSGSTATGTTCALTVTSVLTGKFARGANTLELVIPYAAGTASKNFRLANDAKTDTGVKDTSNSIKAGSLTKTLSVTGAYKIFHSSALAKGAVSGSTAPTSATIRAWSAIWESQSSKTFNLTPSTAYGAVAFAIPSTCSVSKIVNANNQNVTSAFSTRAVSIALPDGTTAAYTLYYYEAANAKFAANDTYSVTFAMTAM